MSGQLEQTLDRMAIYYEKQRKQESQIKSALSYPKMLGAILIIVAAALIQFICRRWSRCFRRERRSRKSLSFCWISKLRGENFFIIIAFVMLVYVMLPILRRSPKSICFWNSLNLSFRQSEA